MSEIKKTLTFTILSISLLTVMAGAAIAPALGTIREHFAGTPDIVIQMIVSMPALFIIMTNLVFAKLCALMKTRTLAITGLLMYVVSGTGAFFLDNIWALLASRAVLGISVGMIMPLSTGLLSYYFPPEKQASLMGLSAAMNQMGGVVATLLAGLLAGISWNYAFLVYLLGLVAVIMVILFLPNERLSGGNGPSLKLLKRFHPSVVGMFLVMLIFFIYPTNFAIAASKGTNLSGNAITLIMVGLDVVAFLVGMIFGWLVGMFPSGMKYFAPVLFFAGYLVMAMFPVPWGLLTGSALIGLANGIGVPYLNTIASLKAGKEAATTVMPLLSAALYLGQFISPIVVVPLGKLLFGELTTASFNVGVILSIVFFLQIYLTRNKQAQPVSRH
ncbi:MAG: MFS transporter [Bacteroidales bacterium]|nr:MFS transporter [Bacteroidales bacterium]MBQ9711197.1 MFS transporter [Bacteroidales bacterium]